MPQPYNLTTLEGSETLFELVNNANLLSGGLIGILTLITTFMIGFLAFKSSGYATNRAFAGSGFITALISIFLRVAGLIPDRYMFGAFIVAGVGFIMLRWGD